MKAHKNRGEYHVFFIKQIDDQPDCHSEYLSRDEAAVLVKQLQETGQYTYVWSELYPND